MLTEVEYEIKGRVWSPSAALTPLSSSGPAALRLILPQEFDLARLRSHNSFKSPFEENAVPFHRQPRTLNPICKASQALALT